MQKFLMLWYQLSSWMLMLCTFGSNEAFVSRTPHCPRGPRKQPVTCRSGGYFRVLQSGTPHSSSRLLNSASELSESAPSQPLELEISDVILAPIDDEDATAYLSDGDESADLSEQQQQQSNAVNSELGGVDAEQETLELLEWSRLCQLLVKFTSTEQGEKQVAAGLPIPSKLEESLLLQSQTKEVDLLEGRFAVMLPLKGATNIEPQIQTALLGGQLTEKQLLDVADTITAARSLHSFINTHKEHTPQLHALIAKRTLHVEVEQEIRAVIDDGGFVRDSASPELLAIRGEIRELTAIIKKRLLEIVQTQSSALYDRVISQRHNRFVLVVKANQKHRIKGIVHDVSASGASVYLEPATTNAHNTKLQQLKKQETRIVNKVLKKLTNRIGTEKVAADLVSLLRTITQLDLAATRSRFGRRMGAVHVELVDCVSEPEADGCAPQGRGVALPGLRHPLLVFPTLNDVLAGSPQAMVPMDYAIPAHIRSVVLTGPNTGGKTISLKTLGIAVLMAKAGMALLVDDTDLVEPVSCPWFDKVLADIGDDQSIEQNLSTFSGHISRIRRILAVAGPSSLVLLDEVGSGTDPTEGSVLGIALLKELVETECLTLTTTHHSELKSLKYSDTRFENACVEFDEVSMSPTYRLLWGIPGRSNALSIASRLGLEPHIIDRARELLGAGQEDMNEVIATLQLQQREQERLRREAEQRLREVETLRSELEGRMEKLRTQEMKLREFQAGVIDGEISKAKKQVAKVVGRLQREGGGAQGAAAATQQLGDLETRLVQQQQSAPGAKDTSGTITPDLVRVGSLVQVLRLGEKPMEVLEVQGKKLLLSVGNMKLQAKLTEVSSIVRDGPEPKARKQTGPVPGAGGSAKDRPVAVVRTQANSLDMRGFRSDEVDSEIEKGVSRALAIGTLWIVHGKGTGKLRECVRQVLKDHPAVERMEDASQEEGGSGVTVAYLR